MVLRSRRQRENEFAMREAAGEPLWTEVFDERAIERLDSLWKMLESSIAGPYVDTRAGHASRIAATLRVEGGWPVPDRVQSGALKTAFELSSELALDMLESVIQSFAEKLRTSRTIVNTILREQRIGYRVVEHKVLDRGSVELHESVVAPALQLLISRKFSKAHDAYVEALKEITAGKSGDAITDAGTALQETFLALGCSGYALGPLIDDAVRKGLLAPHDKKLADWASADRSTTGDAHRHSGATEADAWLSVHVTGALIVRLTDPRQARGSR